jgi:hypothetical protein
MTAILMLAGGLAVKYFLNSSMFDLLAFCQSGTRMEKNIDTRTSPVLEKVRQSEILLVWYMTETTDVRMPMPTQVSLMLMPGFPTWEEREKTFISGLL